MTVWTQITIEELEADAIAFVERAEMGERFEVSRNGVVILALVPKEERTSEMA
ncbi:MAG: hypothetical protein ACKVOS_10945 [Sphingorhabdus sp.]|uniref:hypothetical protein n=1 Tax=Sphingorhabdus sp. TaxID=1902408 RepID=UPI0038FC2751